MEILKSKLKYLITELPEKIDLEDVMYHIYMLQKIETGKKYVGWDRKKKRYNVIYHNKEGLLNETDSKRKNIKNKEPLAELLNFAEKDDLVKLVLGLAARDNSIRRECLDTLKETVKVSNVLKEGAASSALLSLWRELEPELAELDEYGGGDHGQDYRFKAEAAKRVRHVLVDVMKKPADWRKYVLPIKMNNMGRPAFQEEFAKVIPEWKELK